MKLPPKKKPGDPVLAADWNIMVDALAARTPRCGPNNDVLVTSGGFTFRNKPTSSQSSSCTGLTLTRGKPAYVKVAPDAPEDGFLVWVTLGVVNDRLPDNYAEGFPVTADRYFFLKIYPSANIDRFVVQRVEIVHGESYDTHTTAAWGMNGEFPEYVIVPLGFVHFESGAIYNWGCGSIQMTAVISRIWPQPDGSTTFQRDLSFVRLKGQ